MLRLVFSPVELEVWDWDKLSSDDLIGGCRFTFRNVLDAISAGRPLELPLIHPGKARKKSSYKNSGIFRLHSVRTNDYITCTQPSMQPDIPFQLLLGGPKMHTRMPLPASLGAKAFGCLLSTL